jgi:hypothetical protein
MKALQGDAVVGGIFLRGDLLRQTERDLAARQTGPARHFSRGALEPGSRNMLKPLQPIQSRPS